VSGRGPSRFWPDGLTVSVFDEVEKLAGAEQLVGAHRVHGIEVADEVAAVGEASESGRMVSGSVWSM
jgi:hypothetical protein